MKPIKNAITYKCALPSATALESHFAAHKFREIGAAEYSIAGFVPVLDDRYVLPFPGGYAFKLRFDEKILPKASVNHEAQKRIAAIEQKHQAVLSKEARNNIVDQVYNELIEIALVKSAAVTAYYRPEDQLLIVATSSKFLADVLSSRLVKAVGSIKATTIYIDGITQSLTEKLRSLLNGGEGFGAVFGVGGVCKMKGEAGKAVSVKVHHIDESRTGLIEAIEAGHKVVELELSNGDVSFRLNHKFSTKGIFFHHDEVDEYEADDEIDAFQHEASYQMLWLANAFRELLTLFEYKEPVADTAGGAA